LPEQSCWQAGQSKFKSKFEQYSKMQLQNGMSGAEIAEKMLADNGIRDVRDFGSGSGSIRLTKQ
jgi:Zn-dependent membrane protease YugP